MAINYFSDPRLVDKYCELLGFAASVASCYVDCSECVFDFGSLIRQIKSRVITYSDFMDSVKFPACVVVAHVSRSMRDSYLSGDRDWKLYAKQIKRLSVLL